MSSFIHTERIWTRVLSSPTLAVAAALALRLALLWLSHHGEDPSHPKFFTVGLEAHLVASSLAAGKGFFGPYPGYELPTACLAPVYPFLWSIGDKLFHLSFSAATLFAQIMSCIFSAATCWPIFGIGKRIFSNSIGLASAWFWVFLPYAVLFPLEWTWDQSLSALMLALIVYVSLGISGSSPSLSLTGFGLLWALAALVNPTLCILLPCLLACLMLRRKGFRPLSLASAAKVIAIFILAVLPWTIRNYYAVDGLVFVKSNFGLELWLGNNPAVKDIDAQELNPMTNYREAVSLILNGEVNYNREKQREAVAFIEAHPRMFFKNVLKRFEDTWWATYDSRRDPWIRILRLVRPNMWFCLSLSALSFAGMILALRSNWRNTLPLAVCLLLFPIPYYITHTSLRYRHPIDPFMVILTAYAITRFWDLLARLKVRRRGQFRESLIETAQPA
jgi:4-amino-4-deoxy-L-arabinose transferase-like glycosyltransferase